jgi:uncharacterized protein (TIGR04255 family)
MSFPDSARVIYQKNPLAEVSAELKFPTILKIDSNSPAEFQDLIRADYPTYKRVRGTIAIPSGIPQPVQNIIKGMPIPSGPPQHLFATEDRKWVVSLTRERLGLKTVAYQRWEEFRDRFLALQQHFENIYQPAFYSRVALRYVDIIRRSILGLDGVPWSELLKPYIAAELAIPDLAERIDSASSDLHCSLEGTNCFLTLKTSMAIAEPNNEKCFVIDNEFHTHSRTEITDVSKFLDTFNRTSGRLFRWAIEQRLHDALQPTDVG